MAGAGVGRQRGDRGGHPRRVRRDGDSGGGQRAPRRRRLVSDPCDAEHHRDVRCPAVPHRGREVDGLRLVQRVAGDDVHAGVGGHRGKDLREFRAGPAGVDWVALEGQRRQQPADDPLGACGQFRDAHAPAAQVVEEQQARTRLRGDHADAGRAAGPRPGDRQGGDGGDQLALVSRQHGAGLASAARGYATRWPARPCARRRRHRHRAARRPARRRGPLREVAH